MYVEKVESLKKKFGTKLGLKTEVIDYCIWLIAAKSKEYCIAVIFFVGTWYATMHYAKCLRKFFLFDGNTMVHVVFLLCIRLI